jgi:hypothetical protein
MPCQAGGTGLLSLQTCMHSGAYLTNWNRSGTNILNSMRSFVD